MELDDGTKIPIVRKLAAPAAKSPPLPTEQDYSPQAGQFSPKLKVSRAVNIPAATQMWVNVKGGTTGLSVLEANPQLYAKHRIYISNGVVHIVPLQEFKVPLANFSSASKRLSKTPVVGFVSPHPREVVRMAMPFEAVLAAAYSNGSPFTVQEAPSCIELPIGDAPQGCRSPGHLPAHVREHFCTMLAPYAEIWNGNPGEVRATQHRIELTPSAKAFRCQPSRAGPRAREAEQSSVDEMLASGVISRSKFKWASPVVFIPKPTGPPLLRPLPTVERPGRARHVSNPSHGRVH